MSDSTGAALNPTICRRLLTTYLIEQLPKPNNPALEEATGWPRRTVQDIIAKGLPGHGTKVSFVQEGVRNNDGYYRLESWGSIDRTWVHRNLSAICETLELAPENMPVPKQA